MKTFTHTFNIKHAILIVAVAGLLLSTALVPINKAEAQADSPTRAELMAQIQQLLQIVAQLQAQLAAQGGGTGNTVADVCPYEWHRDLSIGKRGDDVKKLQQFLNSNPETRIANAGFGSPGEETNYYGNATANAVSKFQEKYRAEVLSPLGLVNPTGSFGPATRAKANDLCDTPSDEEDEDEDMDDEEDEDEDEGMDDEEGEDEEDEDEEEDEEESASVSVWFLDESTTLDTNDDATESDDAGVFELEYEITAVNDDIYIPYGDYGNAPNTGYGYGVYDSAGDRLGVSWRELDTGISSVSTTADRDDEAYRIDEGETETFTLKIVVDPVDPGFYKVLLEEIRFNTTGENDADVVVDVSDEGIETDLMHIPGTGVPRNGSGDGDEVSPPNPNPGGSLSVGESFGCTADNICTVGRLDHQFVSLDDERIHIDLVRDSDGNYEGAARFEFEFELIPDDTDLYIQRDSFNARGSVGEKADFMDDANETVAVTSSADTEFIDGDEYYVVQEGEAEYFNVVLVYDPIVEARYMGTFYGFDFLFGPGGELYTLDLYPDRLDTDFVFVEGMSEDEWRDGTSGTASSPSENPLAFLSPWGEELIENENDIPSEQFRMFEINTETFEELANPVLTNDIYYDYLNFAQEELGAYWIGMFELPAYRNVHFDLSNPQHDEAHLYVNGERVHSYGGNSGSPDYTFQTKGNSGLFIFEIAYESNWHAGTFGVNQTLTQEDVLDRQFSRSYLSNTEMQDAIDGRMEMFTDLGVYAASVYESGNDDGRIRVDLPSRERSNILILTSYEPVRWDLYNFDRASIYGVFTYTFAGGSSVSADGGTLQVLQNRGTYVGSGSGDVTPADVADATGLSADDIMYFSEAYSPSSLRIPEGGVLGQQTTDHDAQLANVLVSMQRILKSMASQLQN